MPTTPEFILCGSFNESLTKLNKTSRDLVKKKVFDYFQNRASPGFHLERIRDGAEKNFWSARVSDDLRMIIHRDAGRDAFLYVARHDDAYAWARRHGMQAHSITGAMQLYPLEYESRRADHSLTRKKRGERLFRRCSPERLLALGVPPIMVDEVREWDEADFEHNFDCLPEEAAERLLSLAYNQDVPEPRAPRVKDPFFHPDAQRRFFVPENENELRRVLDAPLARWLVFLHPSQRSAIERRTRGPFRVSGPAGTGKTVAAMHRAAYLARAGGDGRILLTTFSKTLSARLIAHFRLLMPDNDPDRRRVDIQNLHKLAYDMYRQHRPGVPFSVLDAGELRALVHNARRAADINAWSFEFLMAEWQHVVDAYNIQTEQQYLAASRAGRGTPLTARDRRELWAVFGAVRQTLKNQRQVTWDSLFHQLADILQGAREWPYRHVIADECQDLGVAELRLLRSLAPVGENDLFLCGDMGQQIFRKPFAWSAAGVDIQGRSVRFRVNYRTTEQIKRRADAILPPALPDPTGSNEDRYTISLLKGPEPTIRRFDQVAEERGELVRWLKERIENGVAPEDIAIFARTKKLLESRAAPAVRDAGCRMLRLREDPEPSEGCVALGTMHRAKGLEYRMTAVIGAEEAEIPNLSALKAAADDADRADILAQERQLLYVAMTRAREDLLVTHVGAPCPFLLDTQQSLPPSQSVTPTDRMRARIDDHNVREVRARIAPQPTLAPLARLGDLVCCEEKVASGKLIKAYLKHWHLAWAGGSYAEGRDFFWLEYEVHEARPTTVLIQVESPRMDADPELNGCKEAVADLLIEELGEHPAVLEGKLRLLRSAVTSSKIRTTKSTTCARFTAVASSTASWKDSALGAIRCCHDAIGSVLDGVWKPLTSDLRTKE